MAYAHSKEHAHALIDRMAPGQLSTVIDLIEMLIDPVARSIANAPWDDEPVSEEERREIAAARASLDRGRGVSIEEVLADYGLTTEDFDRMGNTPLEPNCTGK